MVEVGAEYRMYYHTYNPKIKKFVVGLAIAKDGLLKWTKMGQYLMGVDLINLTVEALQEDM